MATEKITKADVVTALYDKTGMNRKEIGAVLDLFVQEIKAALMNRHVVELRGFGTFEVKVRKARARARNPRTGETVSVRSHGIVSFRPGRELKRDVWNIVEDEEAVRTDDAAGSPGESPSPTV